jgi:hypothetical protein
MSPLKFETDFHSVGWATARNRLHVCVTHDVSENFRSAFTNTGAFPNMV